MAESVLRQALRSVLTGQEPPTRASIATVPCSLDVQWHGYWGEQPSGIACGEDSFATASFACVHEHLDNARLCPGCALDLQKAAGTLTCPHCWDGPQQHDCYTLVVIDWDSGEKTIVQEATSA